MTEYSTNPSLIQRQGAPGRKRKVVDTQPWQQRKALLPVEGPMGPYIESFIQHYLTVHSSYSSAYYYRRELELLSRYFPERTPVELGRRDLLDYVSHTGQGLAPRSRKRTVSILRSFYRWLELTELIDKNPAVVLESPRVPKPQPRFLNLEQVKTLIKVADGDLIMQTYIALGAYAALRRDSLHKLLWEDIDFERNIIILKDTKGHKNNVVPMARPLRKYLLLLRQAQTTKGSDCAHVIAHEWKGEWRPYSRTRMHYRFKKCVAAAGLPSDTSTHDLRRTFATTLHQNGVEMSVISRLLGHADISTTLNHYAFTNDTQKEQAIERLPY